MGWVFSAAQYGGGGFAAQVGGPNMGGDPQIEPTRLHIARISFIRLVFCRLMNSDTKSGLIKTNAEKVSPQ